MAKRRKHKKTSLVTTDDGNEDDGRQQPQIYAKDSFNRFCDDEFEWILSYLSLEDRFRLECVSKRFRRTIFASVVDITIDRAFLSHYEAVNSAKSIMLDTIATKCPNIGSIDWSCCGPQSKHIPEVLAVFRDKCRHLRQLGGPFWRHFSLQFVQKLAQLMTRIRFMDKQLIPALIHCHRLSHLSVHSLSDIVDTSGQLLAKNLKTFSMRYYNTGDERFLSAFVAHNQSLKCLRVWNNSGSHETQQLFQQLSHFPQLLDLTLDFMIGNGDNSLAESLRTIGLNCKQLKRLSLILFSDNEKLDAKTLNALPSYPRLRRLLVILSQHFDHEFVEPLKLCKRLTHLMLYPVKLSDTFLVNCDKQWPRLQYLQITCGTGSGFTIGGQCLSHISRLRALQMLVIDGKVSDDLNDNALKDLLATRPKLKRIEVNGRKTSIGLPSK